MLSIENITTGDFCLAYACNTETHDGSGQWEVQVLIIYFYNKTLHINNANISTKPVSVSLWIVQHQRSPSVVEMMG